MATRYYFNSASHSFNPATQGTWDVTGASAQTLSRSKTATSSGNFVTKTNTSTQDILTNILVSEKLVATTISGTFDLGLFAQEELATTDAVYKVHIWVSAGDTNTVRGTLLNNYIDAVEFATSGLGQQLASTQSLSSVTIQDGDRIVIELGYHSTSTSSSTYSFLTLGGSSVTNGDVVPGSTTGSGRQTWVEFSQTLTPYVSTRMYSTSATPTITPTRQGSWSVVHGTPYSTLAQIRTSSTATTMTVTKTAAANQTGLCTVMVSPALSAQTLSCSMNLCLRMSEGSASNDMVMAVHAWVVDATGTTVRATLVNNAVDSGNEFSTVATGKSPLTPFTISGVGIQAGDRIVVELGWSSPTLVNTQAGSVITGSTTTTSDLASGSTSAFAAPWIEFGQGVKFQNQKEVTADAVVVAATLVEKDVTADALVQVLDRVLDVSSDAQLQAPVLAEIDADAIIQIVDNIHDITADALLNEVGQVDLDVTADGTIFAADQTLPVAADGYVSVITTVEFTGDALIIIVPAVELTADGYIPAVPDQTKELTTDAWVVTGVETATEITTDALIAQPYEIFADAIVTTELGAGMLVGTGAAPFTTMSDLRIALADRTDGTRFVSVDSIQGYEFVAGFSTDITAIALAIDLSQSPVDPITVTMLDSTDNVLDTFDIDPALWSSYIRLTALPGWFLFTLASSFTVTAGETYRVTVSGEGKLLCTENASTTYGMSGMALNVVLVSAEQPTAIDGRAMLCAAPVNGGVLGVRNITVPAGLTTIDSVLVGPNVTLTFAAGQNVTMNISRRFDLNAGASLVMTPSAKTHVLNMGEAATCTIAGTLTMTGASKTRATMLSAPAAITSMSITVDDATGWQIGDRLYIDADPDGDGVIVTISSIAGNIVTLEGSLGASVASSTRVLNITRSTRIAGRAPDLRPAFTLASGAAVHLSHAEFRSLGTTTCLQPSGEVTLDASDLVISDLRVRTTQVGGTAMDISPAGFTFSDITIVRAKIGMILRGSQTISGTTYIAAISDTSAGVKQLAGSATMDLVTMQTFGGSVNLSGGTGFAGSLQATLGTVNRSAFIATSAIARKIDLTNSAITGPGTNNCLIRLASGGGLYQFLGENLTTDIPYVGMSAGAVLLGDGEIVNGTSTADSIVTVASTGFIRLRDEDGIAPISVGGTITPGSRISNRDRTVTDTGESGKDTTTVYAGSASFHIACGAGATEHTVELARIEVVSGENVTITAYAYGEVSLSLMGLAAPEVTSSINESVWTPVTITTIATTSGVLVLSASTTSAGFLDSISRG